jgi:opine dehydrogenase
MPPRNLDAIAVIGAGNGGHAMAAHMSLKGLAVRFYELPRFAENIRPVQERGGIELTGVVDEGFAKLELITTDIATAVKDASHIFVVTQALAHEEVARLYAPYAEENQTIVLFPGSGGALQVAKTFRDTGVTHKIYIAEAVTLPYSCRIKGPAWVNIHHGSGEREVIAAFPGHDIEAVIESTKLAYPMLTPATHVLETALYNGNVLLHPIGVIFNLGRIEYSQGEFWMYKEGFTPSVLKIMEALDNEKMALLRALEIAQPMPFEAYYEWRYQNNPWVDFAPTSSKGPASAQTRYISEDIPIGMTLWASLGEALDVPTPTAHALIHISSIIHNTDYWQDGRTLEKLGLAGLSAGTLNQYLITGEI